VLHTTAASSILWPCDQPNVIISQELTTFAEDLITWFIQWTDVTFRFLWTADSEQSRWL